MLEIGIDFNKPGKFRVYRLIAWAALILWSMYEIHTSQTLQLMFSNEPLYLDSKSHALYLFMLVVGVNCILIEISVMMRAQKRLKRKKQ